MGEVPDNRDSLKKRLRVEGDEERARQTESEGLA
jgi:hypothetical protein